MEMPLLAFFWRESDEKINKSRLYDELEGS